MKRVLYLLLTVVLAMCTACSSENPDDIKTYDCGLRITWQYFNSAEEMIEGSSHIFEGRVIDIDFYVYNRLREAEQRSPVDPEEAHHCYLYTVYKIAVIRTYKGKTNLVESVRLIGGLEDQLKVEQKKVLEQAGIYDPDKGIPLIQDTKHVELNETYLFCVAGRDGERKNGISPYHFAIPKEPLYPHLPGCTQEELLSHLPYVPHPLLICSAVVAVLLTVLFILQKKQRKQVTPQDPETQ